MMKRRDFLKKSMAVGASVAVPTLLSSDANAFFNMTMLKGKSCNDLAGWILNVSSCEFRRVKLDSAGNIHVVGTTTTNATDTMLMKFDTNGTILWQRSLSSAAQIDECFGLCISAAGDVYVAGQSRLSGSQYDLILAKYNSSGTLQWQRQIVNASARDVFMSGSAIVVVGSTPNVSENKFFLAIYTSAGSITYQRYLFGSGELAYCGATDGTYIYFGGWGGNGNSDCIACYNTSANLLWTRSMNDPFFSYYGMAGVSGGGIVGCGGGGTGLVEVNSSGDIVFNKTINETMFDVATDPAGNIYVTGPGAANVTPILKFNSTGTLLWKKTIGMSGLNGRGITTDGVHVYVCGTSTGGSFLLKVDANGPCDGTYGACTIAPGTSIVGTGSPTNSAYTAASSVGSRTEQALTLTNNTPAYTRTIQSI